MVSVSAFYSEDPSSMVRGGGVLVSVSAFYSQSMSSIPAGYSIFISNFTLVLCEKTKINEKGARGCPSLKRFELDPS